MRSIFSKCLLVSATMGVKADVADAHGTLSGKKTFTMVEANKVARLAQLSSCEPDKASDVEAWTCETCVDSDVAVVPGSVRFVHGEGRNNTQALVGKLALQDGCFLAIRGSHTMDNWVHDFELWYHDAKLENYPPCSGCKVHAGFYEYWERLRDPVSKALEDVGCKKETGDLVYITGHSLGGALAHLAAFTFRAEGYKLALMYSFEAPRVGNYEFADAYNRIFGEDEPCYRITHDRDVVVHAPPEVLGFVHVNTEIYFKKKGSEYKVCEKTEQRDCSNKHWDVPWDLLYTTTHNSHCRLPAFGHGFDICSPKCFNKKVTEMNINI